MLQKQGDAFEKEQIFKVQANYIHLQVEVLRNSPAAHPHKILCNILLFNLLYIHYIFNTYTTQHYLYLVKLPPTSIINTHTYFIKLILHKNSEGAVRIFLKKKNPKQKLIRNKPLFLISFCPCQRHAPPPHKQNPPSELLKFNSFIYI